MGPQRGTTSCSTRSPLSSTWRFADWRLGGLAVLGRVGRRAPDARGRRPALHAARPRESPEAKRATAVLKGLAAAAPAGAAGKWAIAQGEVIEEPPSRLAPASIVATSGCSRRCSRPLAPGRGGGGAGDRERKRVATRRQGRREPTVSVVDGERGAPPVDRPPAALGRPAQPFLSPTRCALPRRHLGQRPRAASCSTWAVPHPSASRGPAEASPPRAPSSPAHLRRPRGASRRPGARRGRGRVPTKALGAALAPVETVDLLYAGTFTVSLREVVDEVGLGGGGDADAGGGHRRRGGGSGREASARRPAR